MSASRPASQKVPKNMSRGSTKYGIRLLAASLGVEVVDKKCGTYEGGPGRAARVRRHICTFARMIAKYVARAFFGPHRDSKEYQQGGGQSEVTRTSKPKGLAAENPRVRRSTAGPCFCQVSHWSGWIQDGSFNDDSAIHKPKSALPVPRENGQRDRRTGLDSKSNAIHKPKSSTSTDSQAYWVYKNVSASGIPRSLSISTTLIFRILSINS